MLPPFYYRGVPDDGLFAFIAALVEGTADRAIPLYLYHFPANSGVPWSIALIKRLRTAFAPRIVGLKDSSGDMGYAREAAAIAPDFAVFPSTEAALMEARSGAFAGCISATAPRADLCARAWHEATRARSRRVPSAAVRRQAARSGVKAVLAHIHGDPAWARVMPPLAPLGADRPICRIRRRPGPKVAHGAFVR
jgi:4-hydroxy-tetrahydrodipicolinate synthase